MKKEFLTKISPIDPLKDESIEQVDSFKYLGCNISSNMNCCQEVKQRIAMAKEALGKTITEETSEVFCVEFSVVWCRDLDTRRHEQKELQAFEMWVWRRMERVKWADKIKQCSCARKHGRRENKAGTDKEVENKLAEPLVKKELFTKVCSKRNGKRDESSWQKKISDDRQHYDNWAIWRYEKQGWDEGRVENAEFAVKDLPLGRTLWLSAWLIYWMIYTRNRSVAVFRTYHCVKLHIQRSFISVFSKYNLEIFSNLKKAYSCSHYLYFAYR